MRYYSRRQFLAGLAAGAAAVACGPANVFPAPGGGTASSPAVSPTQPPAAAGCAEPRGYMTFAINVHDWRHVSESAGTLLRAIGIFEKYHVRGDFYLTSEMARQYSLNRPDVIDRLKSSGMTISYHIRPPQPDYPGFDGALKKLPDDQLLQTVKDYETYRLDMATGGLIKTEHGGYSYVAEVLGTPPVVASPQTNDGRIRAAMLSVYKSMGAKMQVLYHEDGTSIANPFDYTNGLLARPSDFSITRWDDPSVTSRKDANAKDPFWWNFMDTPHEAAYNPTAYLEKRMGEWTAARPAFVTSLIHENNFPRGGAESWTSIYFADNDKTQPKLPPYDLNAPDPSKPRPQSQVEKIWEAYEEMVAYAAAHLAVVTSADIVKLAEASGSGGTVAPYCTTLAH